MDHSTLEKVVGQKFGIAPRMWMDSTTRFTKVMKWRNEAGKEAMTILGEGEIPNMAWANAR